MYDPTLTHLHTDTNTHRHTVLLKRCMGELNDQQLKCFVIKKTTSH